MRKVEKVIEYAIPNNEIEFKYLIKIEKVLKGIEYEEYLYEDYKDNLETIYNKESKVLIKTI